MDEALIKVANAGLCHTDVIVREGRADWVRYPVIPGHEFSGVVESCGKSVRNLKRGDRVVVHTLIGCGACRYCRVGDTQGCDQYAEIGTMRDGGFAEYCTVPAQYLFKLPDHVSLAEAAMVEPLANAVWAMRRAQPDLGDRVVVIGPGPIGLLAVQVSRLSHPSVLVLVGTRERRLQLGREWGATHIVNYGEGNPLDAVRKILGNGGADVVLECAGTRGALELALQVVGRNGRIIVEGILTPEDRITIAPWDLLLVRAASLIGVSGWETSDFEKAIRLIAGGLVNVKPLITHKFSLDNWETAFNMITKHKDEAVKVEFDLGER
jgi:threonine dehydrogenase-like Zn-dependent dehydrogenase